MGENGSHIRSELRAYSAVENCMKIRSEFKATEKMKVKDDQWL